MRTIYIVHGWTYNLEKWAAAVNELKKRGINPVILKVPGLTTDSDKVWDINSYVEWLRDQIDGKGPVVLLGHSNGGRIALNFANKYPGLVQTLILVDSAGVYNDKASMQMKRAVFGTLSKIGKRFTNSPKIKRVLYELAREHDYEKAPDNMQKTMINMINSDKSLDVTTVSVPTHIIWGTLDTTTPTGDANILNQRIKGSTIDWVNGAQHSPFFTHPPKFADIIERLIKK